MGGGLMQLVAYGAQDIYLTGNPQITFFKVVYRRHTNFAIEVAEHTFVGTPAFGNRLSAKITRNGDLVSKMYLRVILNGVDPANANFAWVRRIGHALIREIEIEIGGTKIDRQYGTWLDVWYELARQGDHDSGYAKLIGDIPELTNYNKLVKDEYPLYIPLQFWFNKFVGLAIPLIALQYHDTNIHVQFENVNRLIISDKRMDLNSVTMKDATILVNYIYLDTDERRRFALVGHEYLIEQVQFNGIEPVLTTPFGYILDFNHPTKELVWAIRNGNYSSNKNFLYYSDSDKWDVSDASKVILNKSIVIGVNPEPIVGGTWYEIAGTKSGTVSDIVIVTDIVTGTSKPVAMNALNIINKNINNVYVNPGSVKYLLPNNTDYGITNKINADVTINTDGTMSIVNIVTSLTVRDLSIPLEFAVDTRYSSTEMDTDPRLNIFSNYGLLIDGSYNPIEYALLQFNGHDRFDRREGEYFNYVQPEQHHENTPKDGINCYSFALFPEQHQPSGTANLSRIESSKLTLWYSDKTLRDGLPDLHFFNDANQLFIFALSYNIFRVLSGMGGIAYGSTS